MITNEPPFALCGPAETLIADGIENTFSEVAAAQHALRIGTAPMLLGALPFDVEKPAALMVPRTVLRTQRLPDWSGSALPAVRVAAAVPSAAEHRARIGRVLAQLTKPDASLHKVVLARALRLEADAPLDAQMILRRLVAADPAAYGYLVDLTPAGDHYTGMALVGASPELLVVRVGDHVTCQPFAGSAARATDPDLDRANGAALAGSDKNRYEHQVVVDTIRETLQPLCTELHVASDPQLSRTAALWHLSTPINGRLRDTSTTAMDLALAMHPTPAVGGVPTSTASALIRAIEGDRGFYAGAVGWCDAQGDGRWVVSIRCAQLSADRRTVLAHSGGGIVSKSDPDDEVSETTTKFATILTALGVEQ